MHRRRFLALGVVSAAALGLAGGAAAWLQPGLLAGRLAPPSRLIVQRLGAAILDGSLPEGAAARQTALHGLLERVDGVVAALPPHAQGELSQLFSLLATAPGRRAITGLQMPWSDASVGECQQSLQMMRLSGVSLRQQAYHAVHDIVNGAYFSDPATWTVLGYPGPLTL